MANKVYGIDLGTTYSCIAHIDSYGRPEVLPTIDGDRTTPSVILFDSETDVVVGKQAKRQARISPEKVASLVKRHMGDHEWRFNVHGKDWSASALASLICKSVAADAARGTGDDVTDVVITVPAYFGDEERKATKLAGEYAGLNVVDIINEPTAAAFAYGFGQQAQVGPQASEQSGPEETVLVYDLGGGTFDVTVIRMADRHISVVATDGDHELGGTDWDERVTTALSDRFQQENEGAEDPLDDSFGAQDLITSAEEAKVALTARESTDVLVIYGGHRANITLTRDEFEQLTATLLQRTIEITRAVLGAAEARGVTKPDRVLLVGGSSKMPAVSRRLTEEFGFEPQLADPDLSVAKGAAMYGQKKELEQVVIDDLVAQGKLTEGQQLRDARPEDLQSAAAGAAGGYGLSAESVNSMVQTEVENVCSRGFGILAQRDDGELYGVFLTHRNDRLPLVVTETFYTVDDGQQNVRVQVFEQGGGEESERVADNNILIVGDIEGLPPGLPRGQEVEITFTMGGDGTLDVTARHVAKNEPLSLEVETGAAHSAEHVAAERQAVSLLKSKD